MRQPLTKWHMSSVVALALPLAFSAQVSWAQEDPEFSELRALLEINTTDGDAGFQMLIDGDGWVEVKVDDPNGQKIYTVKGDKSVQEQGLSENFFESSEPDCDEPGFSLTETLARFPAGEYRVRGKSTDNEHFEGEAILTHALPGAPEMLGPVGGLVDPGMTTITWLPGDELGNCPPNGADIPDPGTVPLFGYQVIVEREVPGPLVVFSAEVPAGATSVDISPQFMEEDALYKYEVIAIELRMEDGEEVKGNQTISETFFCTAGANPVDPCELPED